MIGDSVPFAAAAACPVCLLLSRLLLTLQTMSTGNPGSFPKRSISSKMPGCSHVRFLQTSEAAPMASLSLPSSQGRSEGRAVRPEWCLRCTMRRRSRSPTTHMRVRSLVSRSRIAADESLLALATNEITIGGGPDEHIFPDTPRRPIHRLRPIPAAALPGERLYRIVMSMRAAGRAMSGQRKRVDHRPGARLQVEVVEPAQHRLGMRHGRRRILATANCLAGHRVHARLVARPRYGGTIAVWAPPVWPDRLVRDL
jgi:hypothetical protein